MKYGTTIVSVFALALSACTSVGSGKDTLIKAVADPQDIKVLGSVFANYLIEGPKPVKWEDRAVPLTANTQVSESDYTEFLDGKFGKPDFQAAALDVTIRNRNSTVPLLPVDVTSLVTSQLADLALNQELTIAERIQTENFLKARFRNVPDISRITTLHHWENGVKVFYYYPRVSIEFSSSLLSAANVDRFDYLGVAVVIKGDEEAVNGDRVRFVDWAPKAADFFEFSRGQFTQTAQVQAKASAGVTRTGVTGATGPGIGEGVTDTSTRTRQSNFGVEGTATFGETFVNLLNESLLSRGSGIHNDGKLFLAELNSEKNRRIGGTYTFDLMLEVPSEPVLAPSGAAYESVPIAGESAAIIADVYLVANVRHVADRGFTGTINKVPEPENDDTLQQVVYRKTPPQKLWQSLGENWVFPVPSPVEPTLAVTVNTNREDARFVVRDAANPNRVLGDGSGTKAKVKILQEPVGDAFVDFLDVIVVDDKLGILKLSAGPSPVFRTDGSPPTAVGNYN